MSSGEQRLRLLLLVGAFMMIRMLEHLWAGFKAVSPIFELLVFLLILYEVYHGVRSRRNAKRRASEIKARSDQICIYTSNGKGLMERAPSPRPTDDENKAYAKLREWERLVKEWVSDTDAVLQTFSLLASDTFLDDATITAATYPDIDHRAWRCYAALNRRLINLRAILDNPDRYF